MDRHCIETKIPNAMPELNLKRALIQRETAQKLFYLGLRIPTNLS